MPEASPTPLVLTTDRLLLRRLGMREEGHHLENDWFRGEWADEIVFALLKREWDQVRIS